MDRWIKTAWKAFWVGLGASAVLVTQSLLAPGAPAPAPIPAQVEMPAPTQQPAARLPGRLAPVLSRLRVCASSRCS